ncbi:hypothetical protein LCGC14_3039810 [marine sediment metagenome]|uniref:DUF1064 domain-containing protein n=1 Tax=marine sediment metagenome TaxID=412755 RepID=A0A0F8XD93_9ZZZZ
MKPRPTHIDGYRFGSMAESLRYEELKLLEFGGHIQDLEVHPKLKLRVNGTRIGRGYYTADWRYVEDNAVIIEEYKGAWAFKGKSSHGTKTAWNRLRDLVCAIHPITLRVTTSEGSTDYCAIGGKVVKL